MIDKGWLPDSPPLQGRGRGWGLSNERIGELRSHAKSMRRQPAEPEKRLWAHLSRSQLGGYKFRRQELIGSAIADFYCPAKGLVVEMDGWTHEDAGADARRDNTLRQMGLKVLRFTNTDAMHNLDGVLQTILSTLNAMPDRRNNPHPNPSPEGEGLFAVEAQKLLGISLEGSVG